MKFLIFSDIHLYEFWQFATILDNGINSRLQDGLDILQLIVNYVNDNDEIAAVLHAGDFFQTKDKISWVALMEAVKILSGLRKPSVWASGNHDLVRGDYEFPYTAMDALVRFSSLKGVVDSSVDINGFTIVAVPYCKKFGVYLDRLKKIENKEKKILLTHGEVTGAVYKGYHVTKAIPQKLLAQFAFSIVGHFHHPMMFGDNILVPGAPHHQNWSDAGTTLGVWVLDTDGLDGFSGIEFLPIQAPKFIEVEYDKNFEYSKENFYRVITDSVVRLPKNAVRISKKRIELERTTTQLSIDNAEDLVKKYTRIKGGANKRTLEKMGLDLITF